MKTIYGPLSDAAFRVSLKKLKSKYTEGFDERMGAPAAEKLKILGGRCPLWIHAVSVGEVQAAWPLMKAARRLGFDAPIVISTTTQTGKAMALKLASDLFDFHMYYPWDKRAYVRSAIELVRPRAFVTMETELWPNMLWALSERGIPSFLANGRVSDRTWKRASSWVGRGVMAELYGLFTALFLRDERDRLRLKKIGLPSKKLNVCGDMKMDALLSRVDKSAAEKWKSRLGRENGPLFIAGSTHTGEDEIVLRAFSLVKQKIPRARLIIAPRHPERAESVAALAGQNLRVSLLSRISGEWDVLVADEIGVLFELYGASDAAFVGGSFVDRGGQNILEPAVWSVPVQYGPHMEDFAEVSADFLRMGISEQAGSAEQLAEMWTRIAGQKTENEKFKEKCREYFEEKAGASGKTWKGIAELLSAGETNGKQ